jgi:hypothetical protein
MRARYRTAAAKMMFGQEVERMTGLVDELERRSEGFETKPGDYLDTDVAKDEVIYRRANGTIVVRWPREQFEFLKAHAFDV